MSRKVYVDVVAKMDRTGRVIPIRINWENGQVYEIDKVVDQRPAASTKAGGCGIRYTVRICGHQTYIFLQDDNKWFAESKV